MLLKGYKAFRDEMNKFEGLTGSTSAVTVVTNTVLCAPGNALRVDLKHSCNSCYKKVTMGGHGCVLTL